MLTFVRSCGAAAVLALAAGTVASGQDAPVFRSGVDLVTVDVSVVGADGAPVTGLEAGDFSISVDGIPRRVVRAVYVPAVPRGRAVKRSPHFSSNEEVEPGRLVLLAVDRRHIRRVEGLPALRAAANFLDQLDPADRVAAAPLDHLGPLHFTNDRASVREYLATLTGTASTLRGQFTIGLVEALAIGDGNRTWLDRAVLRECGQPLSRFESTARIAEANGMRDPCPVQVEQESRALSQEARADARTTLTQLLSLIERLAEIEGPKTMVLISEGLVAEPQLVDLTLLGAAAQAARVTLYVLQLEAPLFDASEGVVSPTLQQDLQVKADGLARLAGAARGALFRVVGGDPYPFGRILNEVSGYYLLAFEGSSADHDGRLRRIRVSTRAPGATVRARPGFRGAPARSPRDHEARIVRLLRSPRLATDLVVRATAHTLREPADGRARVVVTAEADAASDDDLAIGYVLIDGAGVIAASGRANAPGGRLSQPLVVTPGSYTLRVAAVDSAGRAGSVERAVEARLHEAGAFAASDLVLTDTAPEEPVRPLVARATSDRLGAVIEVYAPPGTTADGIAITMDVRGEEAGRLPRIAPPALTRVTTSTWRARADFDLRDLPPGDYVVVATVECPGAPPRQIAREFRK